MAQQARIRVTLDTSQAISRMRELVQQGGSTADQLGRGASGSIGGGLRGSASRAKGFVQNEASAGAAAALSEEMRSLRLAIVDLIPGLRGIIEGNKAMAETRASMTRFGALVDRTGITPEIESVGRQELLRNQGRQRGIGLTNDMLNRIANTRVNEAVRGVSEALSERSNR